MKKVITIIINDSMITFENAKKKANMLGYDSIMEAREAHNYDYSSNAAELWLEDMGADKFLFLS